MSINIKESKKIVFSYKVINTAVDKRWDEFVINHPQGSIYHHSAWGNVLESTYGHIPFYVGLERDGSDRLEGIVPFSLIDSKFTGKRLVSLPFTSYCDPLVSESQLENIIHFAFEHNPGVDYIELKVIEKVKFAPVIFERESFYVNHIIDLNKDLDQIFKSFHNKCIRKRIIKAENNNMKFRVIEKEEELKEFYKLHIMVRRKHGLPPHPYAFFANMWKHLNPNFLFAPVVEYQGEIIAAAIVLKFKNTYHFEYCASDQKFFKLSPVHKLTWGIIKTAFRAGVRFVDLGRSSLKNRSLIEFKERWAAKRYNLTHYYYPMGKIIHADNGLLYKIFNYSNSILPSLILKLEGELIYPHLS